MTPRGLSVGDLRTRVAASAPAAAAVTMHADPREALSAAQEDAAAGDRVVAFGSFYVAAVALDVLDGSRV